MSEPANAQLDAASWDGRGGAKRRGGYNAALSPTTPSPSVPPLLGQEGKSLLPNQVTLHHVTHHHVTLHHVTHYHVTLHHVTLHHVTHFQGRQAGTAAGLTICRSLIGKLMSAASTPSAMVSSHIN